MNLGGKFEMNGHNFLVPNHWYENGLDCIGNWI